MIYLPVPFNMREETTTQGSVLVRMRKQHNLYIVKETSVRGRNSIDKNIVYNMSGLWFEL
jgi:hypothetical protein